MKCDQCGGPAAEFAVYPAGMESPQSYLKGDRLERTGFLGHLILPGDYAALCARLEAIGSCDFVALRRDWNPDHVAFHCRECDKVYCEKCWHGRKRSLRWRTAFAVLSRQQSWRIGPLQFDEGFYDCTYGTCPAGHKQIVDD
ncbi:MAG: hypothetical protein ACT4QE_10045 [Anaerolineales bacterium]